jgi:hypothetical protein
MIAPTAHTDIAIFFMKHLLFQARGQSSHAQRKTVKHSKTHRPPQPSLNNGPVQCRVRRAFVATGESVLSTTQLVLLVAISLLCGTTAWAADDVVFTAVLAALGIAATLSAWQRS